MRNDKLFNQSIKSIQKQLNVCPANTNTKPHQKPFTILLTTITVTLHIRIRNVKPNLKKQNAESHAHPKKKWEKRQRAWPFVSYRLTAAQGIDLSRAENWQIEQTETGQ